MNSRDEIARAWDLFRLGAFAEAESTLSQRADDAALHLALWIALRRDDPHAKLEHASRLANSLDRSLAAVGRAHENAALVALKREPRDWIEPTSRWACAEVAYARALIAFMRRDARAVRYELSAALPQVPEQRVRYAELRSWVYGINEKYEQQATHLMHALSIALDRGVDSALSAHVAASLAVLLRELEPESFSEHAERLFTRVTWPKEHTTYRFYVFRALAWRRALHGEWISALALLDTSLACAPNALRRGLIYADRARISANANEAVAAASSLESAIRTFVDVDWTATTRDEPMAVFGAMDVLSRDHERASWLYALAQRSDASRLVAASYGDRMNAFRSFALSYLRPPEEALAHAAEAYRLFKRMKYVHRAADCALRAMELGGGLRWRERAERLVAPYPRSLAGCRFRKLTAPIARLSGRMMDVAELLASTALTAREIGERLGIAEGTVRVHIKRMNRILNTSSRSDLVRYFRDNGSAA